MSAIQLTTDHVNKAIDFITLTSNRTYKEILAAYYNPGHEHYRDHNTCHSRFEKNSIDALQRLFGFRLLFSENLMLVQSIQKAEIVCKEDLALFRSLLITGKHHKDLLLSNIKEVA